MAQKPLPEMNLQEALLAVEEEKSELDKVVELLLDPKNIAHNTELNRNEITAFSVLSAIADKYDLTVLRDFIRANLIYRVSKGRQGKQELVKLASRQLSLQEMDVETPSRFGRFFGRRRGNQPR